MAPKRSLDLSTEDSKKRKTVDKGDDAVRKEPRKGAALDETEEELEKDAPSDKRPLIRDVATFYPKNMTINAISVLDGRMLMAHADGGLQYFIAGARAHIGVKSGRYMFEVRIVEALSPVESTLGAKRAGPTPRQLLRVGFSIADSELVLGEGVDGVGFDSEGIFLTGGQRLAGKSQRFGRDDVVAVVLNLEPGPNLNTISIFRNGLRISEPQPLLENLRGQVLYPHIAYRNVTVQVNFGPHPLRALPFKCRCLQGAALGDVVVEKTCVPKDDVYDVVFPVAFPDEGTFDWVDDFLKKNPKFVELSDRKIIDWAAKSGMWKGKGGWKESNDKPEFNFGIPGMDDFSVQRVLKTVAPLVPRHYVVMEVRGNLVTAERMQTLRNFRAPTYRCIAYVAMGEPTAEFRQLQQSLYLASKQEKVTLEWKAKKAEKSRTKQIEARQKQLEEMRKKADEQKRRAAEAAKKKAESLMKKLAEDKKKREEAAAKVSVGEEADAEMGEVAKEEEQPDDEEDAPKKEEEDDDEVKKEEHDAEDGRDIVAESVKDEDMDVDSGPPIVELTEEEKRMPFRPLPQSDLTSLAMSQSFGHFTIPSEEEGFAEVRFEWLNEARSKEFLRSWVMEKKLTARMEELQPSKWFQEKHGEWLKTFKLYEAKQKSAKVAASKNKSEEEKDEEENEHIDIFAVEDVCDIGKGVPLFVNFEFVDWALLQLRYELYLLVQAYRKDVDDPDRVGIHDPNIAYYYNKYFYKQLSPKNFSVSTNTELCEMIKDTVSINASNQVLISVLSDDVESLDIFVKLTEEQRRERQRRIDAGDETVRLKFLSTAMQTPQAPRPASALGAAAPAASSRTPSLTVVPSNPPSGTLSAAPAVAATAAPGVAPTWRPGQAWRPGAARPPAWAATTRQW